MILHIMCIFSWMEMFNFAAFFYCKLLVLHTKFLQIKNSDKKSVVFTKQLHVIFLLIGLLENMCPICSRKRNWSDQPSGGGWLAGLVYKPLYISAGDVSKPNRHVFGFPTISSWYLMVTTGDWITSLTPSPSPSPSKKLYKLFFSDQRSSIRAHILNTFVKLKACQN